MRTFIYPNILQKIKWPVIRIKTLSIYAIASEKATEKSYNIEKSKLENRINLFTNWN